MRADDSDGRRGGAGGGTHMNYRIISLSGMLFLLSTSCCNAPEHKYTIQISSKHHGDKIRRKPNMRPLKFRGEIMIPFHHIKNKFLSRGFISRHTDISYKTTPGGLLIFMCFVCVCVSVALMYCNSSYQGKQPLPCGHLMCSLRVRYQRFTPSVLQDNPQLQDAYR